MDALVIGILVAMLAIAGFFAPTLTAAARKGAVTETFVFNLMAGWSIDGWREAWELGLGRRDWRNLPPKYGSRLKQDGKP